MNIVVDSALLADALDEASKTLPKKEIIPVMGCFLIHAAGDKLTITGTDYRATVQSYIEENVQINSAGRAALPKVLLEIIQKIKGEVTIEVKKDQAIISSKNKAIEISGMDPDEYPSPPVIDNSEFIEIKGKDLKDLIRKTVFAADIDGKSMPIITGVHVVIQNGKLKMIATNRHRIARVEKDIECAELGSAVVEARGIKELQKIINDNDEVEFGFSKSDNGDVIYAFAQTERFTFYSRVLEGSYPEVESLLRVSPITEITVERSELIQSLELVLTLAREDKNNSVTLTCSSKEIIIKGQGKENGKAVESIMPVTFKGENFRITINAKYMLEVLGILDMEQISIGYRGPINPMSIEGVNDKSNYHVIMPYKVRND
ncbi:DNA polymerase III subunit beta [Paenibacillus medicaginis]|uniref:Beta sliding clamp n=1 Tax=Paenibacillus medicaginis TaxID=1470560 RepID=A0ABV5C1J9_9BACL